MSIAVAYNYADADLCVALAIIKLRNKKLFTKLNNCPPDVCKRREDLVLNDLKNLADLGKPKEVERQGINSEQVEIIVAPPKRRNVDEPVATKKTKECNIGTPSALDSHPNRQYMKDAEAFVCENDLRQMSDIVLKKRDAMYELSLGGGQKALPWISATYRRIRWALVLKKLNPAFFHLVNTFKTYVVSHYSFHAPKERAINFITRTLYYKFYLDMWDKSFESLCRSKDIGPIFRGQDEFTALSWTRMCRDQRDTVVLILRFRARYSKSSTIVSRSIIFILQTLESLLHCLLRFQGRDLMNCDKPKAYEEIHLRRTKTFDNKYEIELMNVLRRQTDPKKRIIEMANHTLKLLKALNWQEIQFSCKDVQELACYRKYIQSALLLTANTNLIASFRIVIDDWPRTM